MIIGQTRIQPGSVLEAIESLLHPPPVALRLAVAYVTRAGVEVIRRRAIELVGEAVWQQLPKQLVTCFDFGITEPDALERLARDGCKVSVAHTEVLDNPGLRPTSAYHPKLYAAVRDDAVDVVVGSANLTDRALTSNSEAVAMLTLRGSEGLRHMQAVFDRLHEDAVDLDNTLLQRYRDKRQGLQVPRPARREKAPDQPSESAEEAEEPLSEAVLGHPTADTLAARLPGILPEGYGHFWVQVESLSGGSRSRTGAAPPRIGVLRVPPRTVRQRG